MIRSEKVWAIARKEFSEFRRNRYVLYSLVIMPLVMTVVLPIIYLVPIAVMMPNDNRPIDLTLNIENSYEGITFHDTYLDNATFIRCNFENVIMNGCDLHESNVNFSLIAGSNIDQSVVTDSVIRFSNLNNVSYIGTTLVSSKVIGGGSDLASPMLLLINILMLMFMIIPAVIPTIIASYTLVGEKINKSLEPLLATPTTDLELLGGKAVSIFIPTMAVTWIMFIPFVILVDVITRPVLGYYLLPNLIWVLAVFVMAPLIGILSILANVIVSSRVSDVRSAQQIGSLVVLPVILFFVIILSQSASSVWFMLLFSNIMVVVDLAILLLALKTFRREEILIRWK